MNLCFNFGLYPLEEMRRLTTYITPIMDGLIEAGHRVDRFAIGLRPGPWINVLPYHRLGAAAAGDLLALKAKSGAAIGILYLGDIAETAACETEDPGLARLAQVADFVWTVMPPEGLPALADAGTKVARIRYGFCARSLGPNLVAKADVPRDIDVTIRGARTPRHQALHDALASLGHCFWIYNPTLPHYVTDDIVARSKVVVDLRPDGNASGGAPALTSQALHNATAIVSEAGAPGWQDDFADYGLVTPFEQIAGRCQQVLLSGLHARLGMAALEKFRVETSMRDNMAGVLRHPAIVAVARGMGAV